MSVRGSKHKEIPILSYRLEGQIGDVVTPIRWSHSHVLTTLIGTFHIQKMRHWEFKRYGNTVFVGPIMIDYEAPDFNTYMTDDGEMLDRYTKGQ